MSTNEQTEVHGLEAKSIGYHLGIPEASRAVIKIPPSKRNQFYVGAEGGGCTAIMRFSYERNRSWHVRLEQIDSRQVSRLHMHAEEHRRSYRLYSKDRVAREFASTVKGVRHTTRDKTAERTSVIAENIRTRAQHICAAIGFVDDGTLLPDNNSQRKMMETMEKALLSRGGMSKKNRNSKATHSYIYQGEARKLGEALGLGGATAARWQNDPKTGIATLTACSKDFAACFLSQSDPESPDEPILLHCTYDDDLRVMHIKGRSDHNLHAAFRVTSESKLKLINPIPIRNNEQHARKLYNMVERLAAAFI